MKSPERPLQSAFPGREERSARAKLTQKAKERAIKRDVSLEETTRAFIDVPFFIGTTAVHGVEPQQIAVNIAFAINDQLRQAGMDPRPILIPYLSGHASYGRTTVEVLQDVYGEKANLIYLSEDLGKALATTEFGSAGYQSSWESVRDTAGDVQRKLLDLVGGELHGIRLDGVTIAGEGKNATLVEDDGYRKTFSIADTQHIVEINAGANVSAATESGSVVTHAVFPVTLDGLTELVSRHPDIFDFDPELVSAIGAIATALRAQFTTIALPALHTLAQEDWFGELFPDAFLTPPLKEHLVAPVVVFGQNANNEQTVSITTKDAKGNSVTQVATGYSPDKGVIHINISGSGLGADAAKRFAIKAAQDGYVVAAPKWIVETALGIPNDPEQIKQLPQDIQEAAKRIIRVGPEILFAKDESGNNLCNVFFMRPGMGSYAYAQLAEVPMLVIGYSDLENPEMWGNTNEIGKNGLGRRYTGRPDSIEQVKQLQGNIAPYNKKVYQDEGIPQDMEGLEYVARVIIAAEVERAKTF